VSERIRAKYFGPNQPFYWTAVSDDPKVSAPSGWYQWTEKGIVYIGASILDCQCDIPNRGLAPVNEVCTACGKRV
jgi:hypothetical protein